MRPARFIDRFGRGSARALASQIVIASAAMIQNADGCEADRDQPDLPPSSRLRRSGLFPRDRIIAACSLAI
jgi:hypothetical protein